MPCRSCHKPGPEYCSNACFAKHKETFKTRECTLCNPKLVTLKICKQCRRKPENKGWKSASTKEKGGFALDEFQAGVHVLDAAASRKFKTPLAEKVVRLIAAGATQVQAAQEAACHVQYVKRVADFWNKATGQMLKELNWHNRDANQQDDE